MKLIQIRFMMWALKALQILLQRSETTQDFDHGVHYKEGFILRDLLQHEALK